MTGHLLDAVVPISNFERDREQIINLLRNTIKEIHIIFVFGQPVWGNSASYQINGCSGGVYCAIRYYRYNVTSAVIDYITHLLLQFDVFSNQTQAKTFGKYNNRTETV